MQCGCDSQREGMIKILFSEAAITVKLAWEIFKSCSNVREDFSRASVFLWIVGGGNKIPVECTAEDGVIEATLPNSLPVGVYGVQAIWTKDTCCKRMMAEVQKVFAVTDVPEDATPVCGSSCVIRIKSTSASYGYDGLDAYEKSILEGKTHLSLEEWLEAQNATTSELERYEGMVREETERAQNAEGNLQEQINAIISGGAHVDITATPSVVFVGDTSNISLRATTDVDASSIQISGGNLLDPIAGSGTLLTGTDEIKPDEDGVIRYDANFVMAGVPKSDYVNVSAVYPIRTGSGASYVDGTSISTPKTSPAGTYNVTVENDGDYVWFNVPALMTIHGATMGGFAFPLESPQNVSIDDVSYKSYRSSNTNDAGTYTIIIS